MSLFRALVFVSTAALVLSACATNPVTGESDFVLMSEDREIELGREAHPDIVQRFGGAYEDAELQRYVERVGERLAAHSHRSDLVYRFTLLDSQEVNAFALPGGYIYITRGLLAYLDSEAEMAAVLGHEIGHVTARHSVQRISAARAAEFGYTLGAIFVPELRSQTAQGLFNLLGTALISGYGREQELQADRLGAEYLDRSGYPADAMKEVIGVLKDQEEFERQLAQEEGREPHVYHGVFASHPSNDRRLQEAIEAAKRADQTAAPVAVSREEFLERIDGLVYGHSADEGVLRGDRFFHRSLDVGLRFPEGWQIDNLPERLVARAPGNAAMLQVTVEDINRTIPPRAFMEERLKLEDLEEGETITPDGLEGYTALANARTGFGERRTRFSVVYQDKRAFVFAGASKDPDALASFDPQFLAAARSVHPLTPAEREMARALRIAVIEAGTGTRFADLARRSPLRHHPVEQLRLLNQLYPDGEPAAGTKIKIIE